MNIWRFLEGGCIFSQSQGNFKGSIPFHSWTIYIDQLSLFLSKSLCLWGCWAHTLCVSLLSSTASPGQGCEPGGSQLVHLWVNCSNHTPLLVMPGDQAANLALSQSSSAHWRVKGKAGPPRWDSRMSSLMECWVCWVPSQGQSFHPSGWIKL